MASPKNTKAELLVEIKKLQQELALLKKGDSVNISEEKFRKLSDLSFEGIAIHQNGKVVEGNKAVCKIFEYEEKEIIGRDIFDFVHPDYHTTVIEKIKSEE